MLLVGISILSACSTQTVMLPQASPTEKIMLQATDTPHVETSPSTSGADVVSVEVSGEQGAYTFSVTVDSPDEGCERYADWWEVISPQGELIYRRVLLHSHVGEQPFTRSGGPVQIEVDSIVWVRAHMHPDGYGGSAVRGSAGKGFESAELERNFASHLEEIPPLPNDCDF